VAGYFVCAAAAVAEIPLFESLVGKGVQTAQGPALLLPAPSIADGMSAAEQQTAIEAVAKPNHTAESLLRKSVVAPFILKITDDEASKAVGGAGRRVDLWFVVYGDLRRLRDVSFWENQVATANAGVGQNGTEKGTELSVPDLAKRGIQVSERDDYRERYLAGSFVLFDRVRIRGTIFTTEALDDESAMFAVMLDPRFTDDSEYPNSWQPVQRDETGKLRVGTIQKYQGAGSYMKATQLKDPADAILVEYHMVFDEPVGWFNGANLLRSKLPILVQDNVRKFRRKLAERQ
jgi:hypothetical protein